MEENFRLRDLKLTSYALGELEPRDRVLLERELQDDAESAHEIESTRQAAALLRQALTAEQSPGLTDLHRLALASHAQTLHQAPSVAAAAEPPSLRRRLTVAGLAAAVFISASLLFVQRMSEVRQAETLPRPELADVVGGQAAELMPALVPMSALAASTSSFTPVSQQPVTYVPVRFGDAGLRLVTRALRQFRWPAPQEVHTEEMIAALPYAYPSPAAGSDLAAEVEIQPSPWNPSQHLARVSVRLADHAQGRLRLALAFSPQVRAYRWVGSEPSNVPAGLPAVEGQPQPQAVPAGHAFTVLYELELADAASQVSQAPTLDSIDSNTARDPKSLMQARITWVPVQGQSRELEFASGDSTLTSRASESWRLAAASASLALALRQPVLQAGPELDRCITLLREPMQETLKLSQAREHLQELVAKAKSLHREAVRAAGDFSASPLLAQLPDTARAMSRQP